MRPTPIVFATPGTDDLLSFVERREPVVVETLTAKRAVQTFNERILVRLSRLDEVQLNTILMRPLIHRRSGEFRPIVGPDHGGYTTLDFQSFKNLSHSLST